MRQHSRAMELERQRATSLESELSTLQQQRDELAAAVAREAQRAAASQVDSNRMSQQLEQIIASRPLQMQIDQGSAGRGWSASRVLNPNLPPNLSTVDPLDAARQDYQAHGS